MFLYFSEYILPLTKLTACGRKLGFLFGIRNKSGKNGASLTIFSFRDLTLKENPTTNTISGSLMNLKLLYILVN